MAWNRLLGFSPTPKKAANTALSSAHGPNRKRNDEKKIEGNNNLKIPTKHFLPYVIQVSLALDTLHLDQTVHDSSPLTSPFFLAPCDPRVVPGRSLRSLAVRGRRQ